MKKSHRFAFTMVEILAVTALISILAAIGFGAYSYAMGRAKESATRALVKQLEAGIEAFHAKFGYYPPSSKSGTAHVYNAVTLTRGTNDMVTAINFGSYTIGYSTAPSIPRQKALKEAELDVFLKAVEPETIMKYLDGNGRITDSYGGTIQYCCPGKINTTGFDLIAPGEDGKFGSGKAATPPAGKSNYIDSSNEWICDDLANF